MPLGIDHMGITVDNLDEARKMYTAALKPLDYSVQRDLTPTYPVIGLGAGSDICPSFWLSQSEPRPSYIGG